VNRAQQQRLGSASLFVCALRDDDDDEEQEEEESLFCSDQICTKTQREATI